MTETKTKPIHAKPSFYALCFEALKEIAKKYGYNLVLHGSLNRDMDLIAIPWAKELKPHQDMIKEFVEYLGGELCPQNQRLDENKKIIGDLYDITHHGRMWYIINLNREGKMIDGVWTDPQYYLDISVIPSLLSDNEVIDFTNWHLAEFYNEEANATIEDLQNYRAMKQASKEGDGTLQDTYAPWM